MLSRRNLFTAACLLAIGLLALALLPARSASAGKPFGLSSLDGAYHFTNSEIRDEAGTLIYCDAFGMVVFDGAGRADIREAWGYGVCNPGGGTPVEDGCFDYVVFPDGSFVMTERALDLATGACTEEPDPAERYVTHCQILDKGDLILCDGSGGAAGAVVPDDRLLWTATAGKL